MAESFPPISSLDNVNNQNSDTTNSPTMVSAKLQVVDGRLLPDDMMTNPGVLQ